MKKNSLYLVINFFLIGLVNTIDASIDRLSFYALNNQLVLITFTDEISINKVEATITRDSVTEITGSCYNASGSYNQANCTFDLGSVTPDETGYSLNIKYENTQIRSESITITFGFVCVPLSDYFETQSSQYTIIICNKEIGISSSTVTLENTDNTGISGTCKKYKEDARKLNCTFDCSGVKGGTVYTLKVTYSGTTVNEPEITIGKSSESFIRMTSTMLIVLIMILF